MKKRATMHSKVPAFGSATALDERFKRYAPEKENGARQADVKEDLVLKQLVVVWKNCTGACSNKTNKSCYQLAMDSLQGKTFSSADVEKFSIALAGFQEDADFSLNAGDFLSALINGGSEENYTIRTNHLETPPDAFGCQNSKNIVIDKNIGRYCGDGMKGGRITIRGNAAEYLGRDLNGGEIVVDGNAGANCGERMEGGEILIAGDVKGTGSVVENGCGSLMKNGRMRIGGSTSCHVGAGMKGGEIIIEGGAGDCGGYASDVVYYENGDDPDSVASPMTGGRITVKGNASKVGDGLHGGEIHVDGEIGCIGDVVHGKIYNKGKLIVDK
jgi:formylmethanofuran dehydrogenase subunit C